MPDFWRATFTIPRVALVCAVVAGALNVGSYVGLPMSGPLAVVHLAIMACGVALFCRIGLHHALAWHAKGVRPSTRALPWRLIWSTVAAAGYLAVVALAFVAAYGEGSAEVRGGREVWVNGGEVVRTLVPGSVAAFNVWMLRVFSAAWLFFGLLIAVAGDHIEQRIRGYRTAAR
jgi:hypothetical protein